jgi:hypothetical protein
VTKNQVIVVVGAADLIIIVLEPLIGNEWYLSVNL